MKCPSCGAENPESAFFCGDCGTNLRSALAQPAGPVRIGQGEAPREPSGAIEAPPSVPFTTAELPPVAPEALAPPPSVLDTPIAAEAPELAPPGLAQQAAPPSGAGGPFTAPPPGYAAPPPGAYPPPAAPPPAAPPHGYAPPPSIYSPGAPFAPPLQPWGGQPGYGFPLPPDGNTSGMGQGYQLPLGVPGVNFGGCVPFGLFAFLNGSAGWGVAGLLGCLVSPLAWPLSLIYAIFMFIQGRETAWRSRRFDNLAQYQDTMQAWNVWGLVWLGLDVIAGLGFAVLYATVIAGAFASAMSSGQPPTS